VAGAVSAKLIVATSRDFGKFRSEPAFASAVANDLFGPPVVLMTLG
jgi:hypothetical protein